MSLTEFLLARIAEDEAEAEAVGEVDAKSYRAGIVYEEVGMDGAEVLVINPARVLAECEAKRRIVALHAEYAPFGGCVTCAVDAFDDRGTPAIEREPYPCPTLRVLALPYADHPDYRQEWKP